MGASIWIFVTLAGVACALTLLFLGMRGVMEIGGVCATGGPFVVRIQCPERVPLMMVASIWGGLVLAFIYVSQTSKHRVWSFAWALWPALFLSLGWNFLDFGIHPPDLGGPAWGSLVSAAFFALLGGLPLVLMALNLRRRPVLPGQTTGSGVSPRPPGPAVLVSLLERLAVLRRSGALDAAEYEAAKQKILRDEERP